MAMRQYVYDGVKECVYMTLGCMPGMLDTPSLTPETRLAEDIGFDSLDTLDLANNIDDVFEIRLKPSDYDNRLLTLGELTDNVLARVEAKRAATTKA